MTDTLETFLSREIKENNWSIRELGRRLRISHTHAARLVNGEVRPSPDLSQSIADLFGIPVQTVYELSGLLPPEPEQDEHERQMIHLFRQLPPEKQRDVMTQIRALVEATARPRRA
jgi:transcriptional regulator with XRE-family HTH domain